MVGAVGRVRRLDNAATWTTARGPCTAIDVNSGPGDFSGRLQFHQPPRSACDGRCHGAKDRSTPAARFSDKAVSAARTHGLAAQGSVARQQGDRLCHPRSYRGCDPGKRSRNPAWARSTVSCPGDRVHGDLHHRICSPSLGGRRKRRISRHRRQAPLCLYAGRDHRSSGHSAALRRSRGQRGLPPPAFPAAAHTSSRPPGALLAGVRGHKCGTPVPSLRTR